MFQKIRPTLLVATAVVCLACGSASAGTMYTFEGASGNHSASASFEYVGNELHITLVNTMTTSTGPVWLTGLFFDIDGSPAISSASADANLVSFNGGGMNAYNAHNASQLWAFRDSIDSGDLPFGDQQYGLSAAGFDVFGPGDILAPGGPHPQPAGTDGGIVPDMAGLSIPPGHYNRPFALGSATFTLLLPNGFAEGDISNVFFAFGTGFDEVYFPATSTVIPVPAALPLGLAGLAGIAVARRRRKLTAA